RHLVDFRLSQLDLLRQVLLQVALLVVHVAAHRAAGQPAADGADNRAPRAVAAVCGGAQDRAAHRTEGNSLIRVIGRDAVARRQRNCQDCNRDFLHALLHISCETSMMSSSLRRVSSCVIGWPPPPPLENPHCGPMPSCSILAWREAASIWRFNKSLLSSTGVLVLTRPRITRLPLGRWRSGEKSPARPV